MNHVSSEKDYLKEAQDNLKKAIYKHTSNEEQIDMDGEDVYTHFYIHPESIKLIISSFKEYI